MRAWIVLLVFVLGILGLAIYTHPGEGSPSNIVTQNEKLRAQLKKERIQYKTQIKELRRIAAPILKPTPEGNKILARAFFNDAYYCAAEIINGETGGTWRHDVGYGFQYGPHLIYSGRAYGLGQALPGTKMLAYGADAATNPLTQMIWFRAYANGRYGSVCNAASHWKSNRSW